MSYTYEEALEVWKSCTTLEDFDNLIANTSVKVEGADANSTYLLYSGKLEGVNNYSGEIAVKIAATNSNIYTISDTPLGKLLNYNGKEFQKAYFLARKRDYIANRLGFAELSPDEQGAILVKDHNLAWNGAINGEGRVTTTSIWDEVSKRYVNEASGNFRIIATDVSELSIFYQSELPELLKNPNVTSIEGIPREVLNNMSIDEAFKHLQNQSWINITGTNLLKGHVDGWLHLDASTYNNPDFIDNLRRGMDTLTKEDISGLQQTAKFLGETGTKLAKHVPLVGKLLLGASLSMVAAESSAAMERGDKDEALSVWIEFALEEFGGELIGALAGIAIGAAAASVGVPASVAAALGLGAAVLGGYITEETVDQYADLIRDRDANGVMDLLDRIKNVFMGVDGQLPNRLPPGFTPEHRYSLDTRASAAEMAALAKTSLAYRYALINLNPFVITDYDYSAYASDPQYQYDNYSEAYWNDRAQMAYWRIQYQLQGLDVGEDLNTSAIDGNYDFVDMNTPLSGSDYMQLSIDGYGITVDDHKMIFGSGNADKITGSGESDHLYGGNGNDSIIGDAGNDYLEGGRGMDTLEGGAGQDIINGDAGNDILYGGSQSETNDGESDILYGGTGFNSYIVDSADRIYLTSGDDIYGSVFLSNEEGQLTELKEAILDESGDSGSEVYISADGDIYTFEGDTLEINGSFSIVDFKKWACQTTDENGNNIYSALGITLRAEGKTDDVPDDSAAEHAMSPIIIDLNGNGIETLAGKGVYFDHGNDGIRELSGWVAATDGLLVRDLDGDGKITSGLELFGNNTRLRDGSNANNGFQALTELDGNMDGSFDSRDKAWSSLQIWQDKNSNGKTEAGELYSLTDIGITAIGLHYSASTYLDKNGEYHKQTGEVTFSNGYTTTSADVWFKVDNNNRSLSNAIPVTEALIRLPNARGFGNMLDLRQAMARDSVLQTMVTAYLAEEDSNKKDAMLDQMIYQWAGVQNVFPGQIYSINRQQLAVIEQLTASPYNNIYFGSVIGRDASALLAEEYRKFKYYIEAQISAQTILYEDLKNVVMTGYNSGNQGVVLNLSEVEALYIRMHEAGEYDHLRDINETLFNLSVYSEYNRQQLTALKNELMLREPGFIFSLFDSFRTVSDGNDSVYGGTGNDIIQGNKGDDTLCGGEGNDAYIFNAGDGNDIIYESSGDTASVNSHVSIAALAGYDLLNFGDGLSADQMILTRDFDSLIITFRGSTDSVCIKNYFKADEYKVEKLIFADGTVLTTEDLRSILLTGSDDAQTLYAWVDGSEIHAAAGDDILNGHQGEDALSGDDGHDVLYGGGGNDVLSGGAGNDELDGGSGNDTYLFNIGDGQDYISQRYDYPPDISEKIGRGHDILRFGEDIHPDQVHLSRNENNLVITIGDGTDSVTVRDYFIANSSYPLALIIYADGTVWDTAFIHRETGVTYDAAQYLISDGAGGVLAGGDNNDTLTGLSGEDTLCGNDGNDTLTGGAGRDTLVGGSGSDTYLFNAGDGQDVIYDSSHIDTFDDNTLIIGDGLRVADARLNRKDDDLIIKFRGSNDRLRVNNYFSTENQPLEKILFADGTCWDVATVRAEVMRGTNASQELAAGDGDSEIHAGGGDDLLYGDMTDIQLYGDGGNDVLYDSEGDDVLVGGTGNDTIYGGIGCDTYIFNAGDGQDVIYNGDDNRESTTYIQDTLRLGNGLQPAHTFVKRNGDTLVVSFRDSSDSISLKNYFSGDASSCLKIVFSDGTVWDVATVEAWMLAGNDSPQTLVAYKHDSEIHAAGGNDTLNGDKGNDRLYGDAGDDHLIGADGDDILVGGTGNDILDGGDGEDTYLFSAGDGQDEILNRSYQHEKDTLRFNNLLAKDAVVQCSGYDLIISFGGKADSVTVRDFFISTLSSVESIVFADGIIWDVVTVSNLLLVHAGTDDAQTLSAIGSGSEIHAAGGDDILQGAEGNDALYGDAGNDKISGANGDDTLYGGSGDDVLSGLSGDDLLVGGEGFDFLEGGIGRDALYGDEGGDVLDGGDGNDWLSGGAGNDNLEGGYNDDLLAGGENNDTLKGGYGSDTYLFNAGDGQETIIEDKTYIDDRDILRIGDGLLSKNAFVQRNGHDLVVGFSGTTDSVTIKSYFASLQYQVEHIVFADGTDWQPQDILNFLEDGIPLPLAAPVDAPISLQRVREQIVAFTGNGDGDDDGICEAIAMLNTSRSSVNSLMRM